MLLFWWLWERVSNVLLELCEIKKSDEIIDKGAYRHLFCAFDVEVGAQYAKPYGKILRRVLNII